jgi:hypothetical protein
MFTELFRAVWIFGSIVDDLEPVDNPVADENSVFAPRYHYSIFISQEVFDRYFRWRSFRGTIHRMTHKVSFCLPFVLFNLKILRGSGASKLWNAAT